MMGESNIAMVAKMDMGDREVMVEVTVEGGRMGMGVEVIAEEEDVDMEEEDILNLVMKMVLVLEVKEDTVGKTIMRMDTPQTTIAMIMLEQVMVVTKAISHIG